MRTSSDRTDGVHTLTLEPEEFESLQRVLWLSGHCRYDELLKQKLDFMLIGVEDLETGKRRFHSYRIEKAQDPPNYSSGDGNVDPLQ